MYEKYLGWDRLNKLRNTTTPIKGRDSEDYSISNSNPYQKFMRVYEDKKTGKEVYGIHYGYYKNHKHLPFAYVRDDNSISWNNQGVYTGQGLITVLGYWDSEGMRRHNAKKTDGTSDIYTRYLVDKYKIEIPLYEGSRYFMHNDEPVYPFDIIRRVADRSKMNEVIKEYDPLLKHMYCMLRAMDKTSFNEINRENNKAKSLNQIENVEDLLNLTLHNFYKRNYYYRFRDNDEQTCKALDKEARQIIYYERDCYKKEKIGWEERVVPNSKFTLEFIKREGE